MNALTDQLGMLLERGGWVMYPLLALSIVGVTLIIERLWFWATLHSPARSERLRKLNESLRRGEKPKLEKLLAADRTPYGLAARHVLKHGTSDAVIIEAIEAQRPRFDRFMITLSTIITAAPLLGILGTVLGIIKSFNLLGAQNTLTDPRAVSGGIAEALLTTAFGLVVALLTLFPYMWFRGQGERAQARLESVMAAAQQGFGAQEVGDGAGTVASLGSRSHDAGTGADIPSPVSPRTGDGKGGGPSERSKMSASTRT